MKIWDAKYECMPREELEELQLERLQATLNRVYKNVTFYRKIFDDLEFVPESMQSLSGLVNIPFTNKEDLRMNYPYGMFAVPLREVVRVHSSSGTTEKPVVVGYTRNDIKVWTNLVARVMTAAGVNRDDMVQITFSYGLYTGAFGFHYGSEAIGASVIPTGTGNTEKQIMIMQDYKTSVLISTPTYAMTLAERMDHIGVDPKKLSLRLGLFGGEPLTEIMREEIESRLGITATDNYGLSEIIGPGVAGECEYRCGMHIFEDAFIPEIIDPKTGEQLSAGRVGELVLTTLKKEAFPMIRYRTGDMTSLEYGLCTCGRTMVRMNKTAGRSDDMLIIRGVNVYPSQIESVLAAIVGTAPQYQIVADRKGAHDLLEVHFEAAEGTFFDEMKRQKAFLEMVEKRMKSVIGVSATVKLVAPNTIARHEGSAGIVIDKRKT
jgi:phenylacetate-CoA ligase